MSQIVQYLIVLRETHPTMFVIIVSLFEIVVIHELMQLWKQRSACAAAIRRFFPNALAAAITVPDPIHLLRVYI